MNLIEFIMENAFIFIIIIGAISSMISKGNKKEPEGQQRRPTVTRTLQDYQKKYEETIKQTKEAKSNVDRSKETVNSMAETAEVEISSAFDDYLEKQEALRRKAENVERQIKNMKSVSGGNDTRRKELRAFSKNNVVNGLIMAEILGPPKSKRGRGVK